MFMSSPTTPTTTATTTAVKRLLRVAILLGVLASQVSSLHPSRHPGGDDVAKLLNPSSDVQTSSASAASAAATAASTSSRVAAKSLASGASRDATLSDVAPASPSGLSPFSSAAAETSESPALPSALPSASSASSFLETDSEEPQSLLEEGSHLNVFRSEGRPTAVPPLQELDPSSLLAQTIQAHTVEQPRICGSQEIGSMLLLYSTPERFSTSALNWDAIYTMMEGYMARQHKRVEELTKELAQEASRLEVAKVDDGRKAMDHATIAAAVTSAVSTGFSCSSMQQVREGGCGLDMPDTAQNSDGFDSSREAFSKLMQQKMKTSGGIDRREVEQICRAILVDTNIEDTFCDKLCVAFSGSADEWSRTNSAGEAPSFGRLTGRMDELRSKIQEAQSEAAVCSNKRKELMNWNIKMTQYSDTENSQFKMEREVRSKLEVVRSNLVTLSKKLSESNQKLQQASEGLQDERDTVKALADQASELMKQEKALLSQADVMSQQVSALRENIKKTGRAFRAVAGYKASLETMMRMLVQIYDAAIPVSLRQLGFASVLANFEDFRWPEPKCAFLAEQGKEEDSSSLQSTCEIAADRTEKALVACQSQEGSEPEFSPLKKLCSASVGKWQQYTSEIEAMTKDRQTWIQNALVQLKEVVDDMACPGEKSVDGNEPECLHKVERVFGKSAFVRDYVQLWRAPESESEAAEGGPTNSSDLNSSSNSKSPFSAEGPMLALSQETKATWTKFQSLEQESRTQLAGLRQQHSDVLKSVSSLRTQLTEALGIEREDEAKYSEATRLVEELKSHEDELKSAEQLLQTQITGAMLLWKKAQEEMKKLQRKMELGLAAKTEGDEGEDEEGSTSGSGDFAPAPAPAPAPNSTASALHELGRDLLQEFMKGLHSNLTNSSSPGIDEK